MGAFGKSISKSAVLTSYTTPFALFCGKKKKKTENVHGIVLNNEGFNFVKSGTQKTLFSLLIGHFVFLPRLTAFNFPLIDVIIKLHRRVSICQKKLDLIFIAVINFTRSLALKSNGKENVVRKGTIYNRFQR